MPDRRFQPSQKCSESTAGFDAPPTGRAPALNSSRHGTHAAESGGTMRELFKLESTAGTGHFYTFTKNKKKQQGKLEVMKFDPRARKHVKYVEKKLSK